MRKNRKASTMIHGSQQTLGFAKRYLVTSPLAVLVSVAAFLFPLGCSDSFHCPSESDNVSMESFGRFKISNAGGDATARDCVTRCNYHVYQGNDGGTGSTLQVASASEDIVLVWAYSNFAGYRVRGGWTGKTDRGAQLGDSIADFQTKYPGLEAVSKSHLSGTFEGMQLDTYFDVAGHLTEILVGGYIQP